MSLGCCQIKICYPMFLTTSRATGSKVCWRPEGEAIPAERSGSTITGWMENQELNVRFWNTHFKKVPTCLKVLTNQKQCCGTALIIFVPATYAIYTTTSTFSFSFSWQQVNSYKENLAHRDQKELIGTRHIGIRLDLHLLTCQNLETETSELPHEPWRQVIDFILAQKYLFPGTAFNHANNKNWANKAWVCAWKCKS